MKTEPTTWKVAEIIEEHKNGQLKPNHEYQRGEVWSKLQQQMLIDSRLRGFHLPVFYFHVKQERGKFGTNTRSEIIDGQQRVNAVVGFTRGDFALLDPGAKDSRFPLHLRSVPCEWAGLSFDRLPDAMKAKFLDSEVSVAQITETGINEARDLFVRLQGGADLTSQERRDALPGEFCEIVARIAGREGIAQGHPLFQEQMGMKPKTDRGRTRQFVAQLLTIAIGYSQRSAIEDVNKRKIDDMYYDYLELNEASDAVNGLEVHLNDIAHRLSPWPRKLRIPNHLMMHLVLLWMQTDGRVTGGWKGKILEATLAFMKDLAESTLAFRQTREPDEVYSRYYTLTRNNADRGDTIGLRHAFFMDWIQQKAQFVSKDEKRGFDWIERQYVYLKADGRCAYSSEDFCRDDSRMPFDVANIHHVLAHSKGGRTELSNAVLTHRACNTKVGNDMLPPSVSSHVG